MDDVSLSRNSDARFVGMHIVIDVACHELGAVAHLVGIFRSPTLAHDVIRKLRKSRNLTEDGVPHSYHALRLVTRERGVTDPSYLPFLQG